MVFQHSGGRDFDHPRHSHYSGVILWCFNIVGGEILTIPPDSHSHVQTTQRVSGLLSRYGVINIAIGDKNNAIARSRGREWRVIHSHLLTHSTENTQHRRGLRVQQGDSPFSRGV
jgi:hypothetical protein